MFQQFLEETSKGLTLSIKKKKRHRFSWTSWRWKFP